MRWANFFHIYQPPEWQADILKKVAREAYEPTVKILERNPSIRLTMNIAGSLIEQLLAVGNDALIKAWQRLVERGQIELVGSAMYHPILPLVDEPEARRQIELQHQLLQRTFGSSFNPTGFFPPEMAFHPNLETLVAELGYRWVMLDELSLAGTIGQIDVSKQYVTSSGLGVLPRNRLISDFLSFTATLENFDQALNSLKTDPRSHDVLVTAMDGENLGHHRPKIDLLWEKLVTDESIETETCGELYQSLTPTETATLVPSSWSSNQSELHAGIPYGLWNHPDNPIQKLQWEMTHVVTSAIQRALTDPNYDAARRLLDRAFASDKYWWASATPWWDLPIVIRETQKLADVIDPLSTIPSKTRHRVAKLMEQVASTAERWEKTGIVKQRREAHLKDATAAPYMGGKQVTPE